MKRKFNNIKLTKIYINGFKNKDKVIDIDFSSNNSTIIFGSNGCGKTTLLKLLNAILSRNSEILEQENVEKLTIYYDVYLHNEKVEAKKVEITRNKHYSNQLLLEDSEQSIKKIEKYIWDSYDKSELSFTTSLSLGIERGITNRSNQIKTRDITTFMGRMYEYRNVFNHPNERHRFCSDLASYLNKQSVTKNAYTDQNTITETSHVNLQNIQLNNIEQLLLEKYRNARRTATERIQNALFETLSFVFKKTSVKALNNKPEISNDFSIKLLHNKARIIEALDVGWDKNQFREQTIEILKSINNIEDVEREIDNQILFDLINNMMIQLELEKVLLSSISTFTEHFNDFLVDDKKLVIKSDEIYIDIDGKSHGMDVLSSGERHIFTFLSLIITEGSSRDFIFIDEPEISLNIDWQRKIMRLLEKIAPKTQIVVASHSPMIASRMDDSLVELLPKKEHKNFKDLQEIENDVYTNFLTRGINV